MKSYVVTSLLFSALVLLHQLETNASTGGVIFKSLAKYIGKETGKEATEQATAKMAKEVGEELIERTAQKVVRDGGEKSLVEVGELVAKNGPEVLRALDNAPDALPILKLLSDLPADDIAKAASRLAAGSTGKELATLSTKLGTSVLRAEAKHPGVGMTFARSLGNDGAELSLRLSTDQAVQIGRHVDDIALLPASQQSQLLSLISSNADRFASFVGRFVEKNPGGVLFTAASTALILAESERFLGGDEVLLDKDGNPILDANGRPTVFTKPGLVGRAGQELGNTVREPVQSTLYWLGGVCVLLLSLFGGSKVWKHLQKDRLELQAAREAAKSTKNEK